MKFYSWLWNWLDSRASARTSRIHFDHAAKLKLRRLENRQVLSVSAALNVLTGMLDVSIDIDQAHEPPGYTEIDAAGTDVTITVANNATHDVLVDGHTIDAGGGNVLHAANVNGISVHDNTSLATHIDLSAVSNANGFTHSLDGFVHVFGGNGNDAITGSAFSDVIAVGTGNDTIQGGGGNDVFEFSSTLGTDTLSNAIGTTNVLDLSAVSSNIAVNLQTQSVTVPSDPLQSIDFTGTTFSQILGNAANSNSFQGLDATSTWSIASAGDTYASGTTHTAFSGFDSIIGGSADGTFNFVDPAAHLTSLTTGSAGTTHLSGTTVNATDVHFQNAVVLESTLTFNGTNLTFDSTVDGDHSSATPQGLIANESGTTTFGGAIGGTASLFNLTVESSGTTALNAGIVNATNVDFQNAVFLGTSTTVTGTSVAFDGSVDGQTAGAQNLTVNASGSTEFGGSIGGSQALLSLTTDAAGTTVINTANVFTTGDQVYHDAVQLRVNTTLDSSSAGNVTFGKTLDSITGQTNSLVVNTTGTTTFGGAVGATTALSAMTVSGSGFINLDGNVTTTGSQTYSGAVLFEASAVLTTTDSDVSFGSSVDGGFALTVAAGLGTVTYNGPIGANVALASLSDSGAGTTRLNGNVTTTGSQNYSGALLLQTDETLATTNSNVTFGSTVDGPFILLVAAGSGTVRFDGTVGGNAAITSLNINGGGITVLNSSTVTTTGDQIYNDAVQLQADTTLNSTSGLGNITFNSTVDSVTGQTKSLQINTAGTTAFNGTVGGTDRLSSLTTDAGGNTVINAANINTTGNQSWLDAVRLAVDSTLFSSGGGAITFGSTLDSSPGQTNGLTINTSGTTAFENVVGSTDQLSYLTTDAGGITVINTANVNTTGDQVFNDAVQLQVDTTLASSGGGAIAFGSTLDSTASQTNALTLNTVGTVTFDGVVGGTDRLSSLITDVGGTTVIATTNIHTTGSQTYNDAVQLAADTTLDSNAAAAITFVSTVDSASGQTLALTVKTAGAVTFDGVVGGTDQLSRLTTDGGGTTIINTANINTTGNQTYNEAVQLAVDTTLTSSAAGAIMFGGTLNSSTGQTFALTVNTAGTVTFDDLVGGTDQLSSLLTDAGGTTVINAASINTTGSQTFNDAVQLEVNTTLNSSAVGDITFGSTLDSTTGQTNSLMANTAGTTTFDGAVGGTVRLSALTTDAGGTTVINTASVTTTGNQTYHDAVQLAVDTTLTSIAAGNITFASTLDSSSGQNNSLHINTAGVTAFDDIVGGTDQLSKLTTDGGGTTVINTGIVNTTGDQTYQDAVQLGVDTTLQSSAAGAISFGSTLDSSAGQTNALLVNTAGTTRFNGIVGGVNQLSTLTTDSGGNTVISTTKISTTSDQTYSDAVQLAMNTTLSSSAGGAITFVTTLDSTVGQNNSLVVNTAGTVTFDDVVGGITRLSQLTTDAGGSTVINTASVRTTGNQTYNDAVQLAADTTLDSNASGAITFNGTLDSGSGLTNAMTINTAGTVTFNGLVGGTDQLSSLTTDAGGTTVIHTTQITTTGDQVYHDAVQLAINTTLDSTAFGAITFGGTLDSSTGQTNSVQINTSGTTTFDGIVGGTTRLSSLTTDAGGNTFINTSKINTTGDQTWNDAVQLAVNTTLDSNAAGAITFNSTLDSASGQTNALKINTSGTTTFNEVVGGVDQLSSLTTDAGGRTAINTPIVNTTGNQTYNDAVQLEMDTTLTSSSGGAITFGATLDSASGQTKALTVNTTGTLTFDGVVGGTDRLSSLTTDAGGTTVINTTGVSTTGDQIYNDAVVLDVNTTLSSNSAGTITFNSTLDSTSSQTVSLNVNTAGTTSFNGDVGDTGRLGSLTTDAGGATVINTANINTSGNQTYHDAVQLAVDTTLASSSAGSITFASTMDSTPSLTNALRVNTAGTTTFDGVVGGTDRLSSLTTDVGGTTVINTGHIKTTGDQMYGDAVQLQVSTVLDSNAFGSITFAGTLDSIPGQTNSLLIITTGTTTFDGTVGGSDRLSSLTTDAGGTTVINTTRIYTTGNQAWNDAVQLASNTTLNSSAAGTITFANTLDSTAGQNNSLVVSTAGSTVFNGVVGGTDRLSSLATDAGGVTVLNTGHVNTTGNQTYNDAVQLKVNTAVDSNAMGAISFASTLDSSSGQTNSLQVNTAGTTTFDGTVGGTSRLSSLVTNADGTTVINTAHIKTTGNQLYNDAVRLQVGASFDSSASGAIIFASTLDSTAGQTNSVRVDTSGITTFSGTVGGNQRLSSLMTNAGGTTVINTANIKTTGDQTYKDAVQLKVNTTLDSSASGAITFVSTLDSTAGQTNSLLINTSGVTTFDGTVGGTNRLSSLTTDAVGTTIVNTTHVNTTGSQTWNDAVQLEVTVTLDSSAAGAITFASTLDSTVGQTNSLVANTSGNTTFSGNVGETTRLSSLTTDAGGTTVINTAHIKTTGNQTYNDALQLKASTTLDSSAAGAITFASTLDSTPGQTNSLRIETAGATTFNGAVGGTDRLSSLITNAGGTTIINTASINTTGNQTFNDAVKLNVNTTLDSNAAGAITFAGTLDSTASQTNSLVVNTSGTTTFSGLVGGIDRLSSLTTNASGVTVINTSSVKTTGDQIYHDAVQLAVDVIVDSNASGAITFASTVDSVVGQNHALLVNTSGTTTFLGPVGNTTRLSSLTTDVGGTTDINTAIVNTTGDQTYNDAVQLSIDTNLNSSAAGAITFNGTLDSVLGQTHSLSVNTAGVTVFNGTIGGADQLSSLITGAGGTTVINTANVNTTGNQTYNDAVRLAANTTLTSSAAGAINFNSTLDSSSGQTNALLVNTAGTTTFNGTVGGTDQLSSLATNAGGMTVINTSRVNTTGDQTYNDAVILSVNTSLTSSAAGAITFNSTLDSSSGQTNSLSVNTAGQTTFNNSVGATDRLSRLTTDAGGTTVINTTKINTTGNQTYNDAVQLAVDTTLDCSASGAITFASTLDSSSGQTNALVVNTAGTTTFAGIVGGTDQLSSLTTDAGGNTVINTSSVNTTGNQTWNDAVRLAVSTTLNSSAAGAITFGSTLDSSSGQTNSLQVNAAGTTSFNGVVGGTDRLSSLMTDAGGTTVVNTSNINTTGDQLYNDAVQLAVNTTLNSSAAGAINFASTLDSTPGQNSSLLVNTAGTTTFNGVVGGTNQLSHLTTDAIGTTVIDTANVNTTGNQAYNDAVQLNVDVTLSSSAGGAITFNCTLDSSSNQTYALNVNTSGITTFGGIVGGRDRLANLTTDSGGTTVINTTNVNTTGNQTYSDAVRLAVSTILDSSAAGTITFLSTLDSSSGQNIALSVNTSGTVTFDGVVGGTDRISNLTTDAGGTTVINTASVQTTGNQTYNDAVQLEVNVTLDSNSGGAITFNNTLDSSPGQTNALRVNTAGITTFAGVVGGTDLLSSLTTDAGGTSVINTTSVTTTGNQTWNDALKVAVDTTLSSVAGGAITFNSTLDSSAAQTNALMVNTVGISTFNGVVGGVDQLSSLMTDFGGTTIINTANVSTTGNQTYNDAVQLNVDTVLASSAAGAITFSSTLDSSAGQANSLAVNTAGTLTFDGIVGGTSRLSSLSTDAGGTTVINTTNINTTGNQTWNDAVQLGVGTTLDSNAAGSLTFNATLDSSPGQTNSLLVNTGGTTSFNGVVGGMDQLSDLTTNAGGITVVNTASINTTGDQTYNDVVQLQVNSTLASSAAGAIAFSTTLDSSSGQTNALNVSTAGTVTFDGVVGGTDRLSSLTTGSGGTTLINTANIHTTGNQTYNDAVRLGVSTTLDSSASGDIVVNGTIDGTSDLTQSLTLTSGTGNIHVAGDVGTTVRLANLLITQANNTNFDGSVTVNTFQQLGMTVHGTTTFGDGVGNDAVNTYGTIAGSTDGFQFTGNALVFASGSASLDTNGHDITMTTDALTLPTTFVNAIGQTVTIQTLTNSTSIGLNDASQDLNLTDAQLDVIHCDNVVIGQTANTGGIKIGTNGAVTQDENYTLLTAANVDVNGPFQLDALHTLHANIGQNLNVTGAGGLQTDAGEMILNVGNQTSIAGLLTTNSGELRLNATHDLMVTSTGAIQSVSGIMNLTVGNDATVQGLVATGTGPLNLNVADMLLLSGSIFSNSGTTTLDVGHDIELASTGKIQAVTGDIVMTAGTATAANDGALSMATGAVIDAGSGRITMTADGDVTLGQVSTTNNTVGALRVTSNYAAIVADNLAGSANLNAQSSDALVTLRAVTGIGTAGSSNNTPLQTNIAHLDAVNAAKNGVSVSGDIRINDLNPVGFAIQQIDQQGAGNIDITSEGTMEVSQPSDGGMGVHSLGGFISLSAQNSPSNLDIRAAVDTTGGSITLKAGNDVLIGQSGHGVTGQIRSQGGNVTVLASDANAGGRIFMNDASRIDAGSGQIAMQADADITLSNIVTTNATSSAIALTSLHGGIVDGGDTNTYNIQANSTGALVTIQTNTGIGSETGFGADPRLETKIYEVSIINGSASAPHRAGDPVSTNIGITNAGDLKILQVQQNNLGNVAITAQGILEVMQSGYGVTSTKGDTTLVASGQGASAIINNLVQTRGGNVVIDADLDIRLGATANVGSAGGSLTMTAGADSSFTDGHGQILMTAGSLVNGGSGVVRMTADQDVTLSQVGTSTLVSITSHHGGIVNGNSGVTNIGSGKLALHAATGIGSDGALVINTFQIAAQNDSSGNIQLNNVSGTSLSIGSVDGLSGITSQGGVAGTISITNNNTITADGPTSNKTGGDINLTATGGTADVNIHSPVMATNGNGTVTITADNNIEIFGTGSTRVTQVLVQGTGKVYLTAGGDVIFDPNVLVQTGNPPITGVQNGTGSITDAPPLIYNVTLPQLSAQGVATIDADFGRPGETNFTISVFWRTGVTHVFYETTPGHFTDSYQYKSNPNPDDPSAPIVVVLVIQHDPNIIVSAAGTSTGNHPVAVTGNRDTTTVIPAALAPGEGLNTFVFDTTPPVKYLTLPEAARVDEILHQANIQLTDESVLRLEAVRGDEAAGGERQLIMEVVSPDGTAAQRVVLPESMLDEMLELIGKLPDGKYRFQLREPGEGRERLILEVEVRQGKIVGDSKESTRPPSSTKMNGVTPGEGAADEPADAEKPINGMNDDVSATYLPLPAEIVSGNSIQTSLLPISVLQTRKSDEPESSTWMSLAGRQAWRRAERFARQPTDVVEWDENDTPNESTETSTSGDGSLNATEIENAQGSIALAGITTVLVQAASLDPRKTIRNASAKLSRAAQLFRKYSK